MGMADSCYYCFESRRRYDLLIISGASASAETRRATAMAPMKLCSVATIVVIDWCLRAAFRGFGLVNVEEWRSNLMQGCYSC